MSTLARPTIQLRRVSVASDTYKVQQLHRVTFNAGGANEYSRGVWLDVPFVEPTAEEQKLTNQVQELRIKGELDIVVPAP